MAVVVEQPFPSEVLDRVQLVNRRIGALEVVTPGPVSGGDLIMKGPQLGELGVSERATRGDEPVAVAVPVPAPQRERSLNVGARKIRSENPSPLPE